MALFTERVTAQSQAPSGCGYLRIFVTGPSQNLSLLGVFEAQTVSPMSTESVPTDDPVVMRNPLRP